MPEETAEDTRTPEQVEKENKRKRTYEEMDVDVTYPVEQVIVTDASQRMSKWHRMKSVMLRSCGLPCEETGGHEPTVVKNEAVYIIAKAAHPFRECTVCLVEKSRGKGYVLMPESALQRVMHRCVISSTGQQYSKWTSMEEKMGVKVTSDFQAKAGQVGLVLAKEQHPKDKDTEVLAVHIPDGGVVLVKSKAVKELPVDVVEIIDPRARYSNWPKMAKELGIEEPKEAPQMTPGQAGIAKAERKHFSEPNSIVVAVSLLNDEGTVMFDKSGLRFVKF